MRIGLSILTQQGHSLWSNGIGQNVYHLACLLDSLPFVERVVLLNCGDQAHPPGDSGSLGTRFPLISLADANDSLDVAIEVSGGIDPEWLRRFRARGGRVVYHNCGQPYVGLVESTIFGKPFFFSEALRCDEVWLLPKDRQFTAMMRSIHRCQVREVPYLWSRIFLDETARAVEAEGLSFGYKPGSLAPGKAVAAVFEPNLSPIKMASIPFLICEQHYRKHPDALAKVRLLNTAQFNQHPTFVFMVSGTDLHRDNKVTIEGRDYFARVMGSDANLVVSHQICCPQNYLYLDALAGDYPLIHNSPLFCDTGYYYPTSDTEAGAAQIARALADHDRNLDDYRRRTNATLAALDPLARDNCDAYARALLDLVSPQNRVRGR